MQILEDVRRLREAPAAKREEYEKCKAEHPITYHKLLEGEINNIVIKLPEPCLYCTRARKETEHQTDEPCPLKDEANVSQPVDVG